MSEEAKKDITKDITLDVVKETCIGCFKKYRVFTGRAGRREFWIFFLACFVTGLVVNWIPFVGTVFIVLVFMPTLAVSVRRLHDIDRPGPLAALAFIPIVGLIILIVFWVREGTAGENKYGPDPKA